jgi:hypothetical protein
MTTIRKRAFANRISAYLHDPAVFDERKFDASLYSLVRPPVDVSSPSAERCCPPKIIRGLTFGEHIDLVMILIRYGYQGLCDQTSVGEYAKAMAEAMQDFADPFVDGDDYCFAYPHFLLHGLRKKTLNGVIAQVRNNGRVIHETLAVRQGFLEKHQGPTLLPHGLKLLMEEGASEDWYGICCYLTKASEMNPHGTDTSAIARASFFLDTLHRVIYVISIQGQRIKPLIKERSRDFARLAAKLAMDPRAFVLCQICRIAKIENYRRVKVIRPKQHPMYIDHHQGFLALYEPIIHQADIHRKNGCYLEKTL